MQQKHPQKKPPKKSAAKPAAKPVVQLPLSIPPHFRCPISQEIMIDPVMLPTGITYEREAIEEWLKSHDTCPLTKTPLNGNKAVFPNIGFKNMIDDFLKVHPECLDQVYESRSLKQKLIDALKKGDKTQFNSYLSKAPRFLTKTLEEDKNLLVLACEHASLEILDLILKQLGERFWQFSEVQTDQGLALFLRVARRLGILGANKMLEALRWGKCEIQNLLILAVRDNDLNVANVALALGAVVPKELFTQVYLDQKVEWAELFVKYQAPPEGTDAEGNDFLMCVIKKTGNQNLVRFLCQAGENKVNPNTQNYTGDTPLGWAIQQGNIPLIVALLECPQIDVNLSTLGGDTPLHLAVEKGDEKIVQLLLGQKPALDIENQQKQTPLDKANVEDVTMLTLLLAAGANGERKDDRGENLLMRAIRYANLTLCHFLLKDLREKIEINAANHQGETALMIAAQLDQTDVIEGLLSHLRIKVDQRDQKGNTALHYAAEKGNQVIAQLLLKSSASIKVQNHDQKTPIEMAHAKEHTQLALWMTQEYRKQKLAPILEPLQEKIREQEKEIAQQKTQLEQHQKLLAAIGNCGQLFFKSLSSQFLTINNFNVREHTQNSHSRNSAICPLSDTQIAVGDEAKIKIWDTTTGACIKTLTYGRNNGYNQQDIDSICVLEHGLLAANTTYGKDFKILDMASGTCVKTLTYGGERNQFDMLALGNGLLATVSYNGTKGEDIEIWDIVRGTRLKTLTGVQIFCALGNGLLAIGGYTDYPSNYRHFNNTIKIWDIPNGTQKTFHEETGCSVPIIGIHGLSNRLLASVDANRDIKIWGVGSGACINTFNKAGYYGCFLGNGLFATRGHSRSYDDAVIKIWDIAKGTCVQALMSDKFLRNMYALGDGRFATYHVIDNSQDIIRVWANRRSQTYAPHYEQAQMQIAQEFPECKVM